METQIRSWLITKDCWTGRSRFRSRSAMSSASRSASLSLLKWASLLCFTTLLHSSFTVDTFHLEILTRSSSRFSVLCSELRQAAKHNRSVLTLARLRQQLLKSSESLTPHRISSLQLKRQLSNATPTLISSPLPSQGPSFLHIFSLVTLSSKTSGSVTQLGRMSGYLRAST